jgi:fructoselysine 6-kinase
VKAACFSSAVIDHYPRLGRSFPGGNHVNQCVHFAALGDTAAFIGAVGDDEAGRRILDWMSRRAIDTSHAHRLPGPTARNEIVNDEAGEAFEVPGGWSGGVYADYHLSPDDWRHIASFDVWATHTKCPDFLTAVARKPDTVFLSVDFLDSADIELLRRHAARIDLAFLAGTPELLGPLRALAPELPCPVVLTLGPRGSVAFRAGEELRQPALPAERPLDSTGCGDAFQAAFASDYFRRRDIPAALLAAARRARRVLTHYGATP